MTTQSYETDFLHWTQEQSAALRAGQFAAHDLEPIAEELEDMGREQKFALQSLLPQIPVHLPKLQLSPQRTSRAKWIEEIIEFRDQAQARTEATPSLAHHAPELFAKAWQQARRAAEKAFELYGEPVQVPGLRPYSLEQTLDPDFFPWAETIST